MCGICGQFNFRSGEPASREAVAAMTASLVHRGPDDQGYHFDGPLGLGFRRLSIIDLATGHQPMSDREGDVWLVFNGEIYNFLELRQELEGHGHTFRTRSDTEVIIHGYKQWGEGVLNRLNGMFGLAIWDVLKQRLILARDPFGQKLIYYHIDGDRVSFGSEIRSVRVAIGGRPEVDPVALNLFLRYRFTSAPYTLFKGIRKLAPGTMLSVERGDYRVKRWYTYHPVPFSQAKTDAEATEELLEIYKCALKRHLLSDVPVGLLLSGGLDSSLLLAMMSLYGQSWPTFTVGYGSSFADDELVDASSTAKLFSTNHTEVRIDKSTFEGALPGIVACLEEPIASSSIVPMYFLCQRARQDVKVALSGQGPDELFGGYRRHLGVRYGAIWGRLPSWVRAPLSSAIAALPRNETLKRGVYALGVTDRLQRYQHVLSLLPGQTIDNLFQDGLLEDNAGDAILRTWADLAPLLNETDELGAFNYLELRSTLSDELLMYSDKLSMAHGLEVRVPYLDKEVVEYVERLPASFKIRRGTQKWLHRRVCKSFLPTSVTQRKKRGFAVNVVDSWFRSSIGGAMESILTDHGSHMYRYLRPGAVGTLLAEHLSGRCDNHKILFSLVVFETWLRSHESVPALRTPSVSTAESIGRLENPRSPASAAG